MLEVSIDKRHPVWAVAWFDDVDTGGIMAQFFEEGEDIRVHVWSLEEALGAVSDGRIDNAASIIALQWLALNREQVRGEWV